MSIIVYAYIDTWNDDKVVYINHSFKSVDKYIQSMLDINPSFERRVLLTLPDDTPVEVLNIALKCFKKKYNWYGLEYGLGHSGCSGFTHTESSRMRISKGRKGIAPVYGENHHFYGKHLPVELSMKISSRKTSTGFFRVHKQRNPRCKKGFTYVYSYADDDKRKNITSVTINGLECKVRAKGLPWSIIDEGLAKKTLKE